MIEDINSFLLLTLLGVIHYIHYKYRIFFGVINVVTDSAILDQLSNLAKGVDSEVTKPKRGRKKKTDNKMNEVEENDMR